MVLSTKIAIPPSNNSQCMAIDNYYPAKPHIKEFCSVTI